VSAAASHRSAASPDSAASHHSAASPDSSAAGDDVLVVDDLNLYYPGGLRRPALHALRGVSLHVGRGETLAVVGESGSGKSTLGSAILGIHPSSSGTITFRGTDITNADRAARRQLGAHLQAVFQDPYSSLNPVRTIGQTLTEPLITHQQVSREDARQQVIAMLGQVGLPASAADQYPAEFSGGQRQRIAIARALMPGPSLIVCDEPVSSLDVSVQAQVLNLLTQLQAQTACSYLFISHNLTVVRHFSRRVLVLHRGMVLEEGTAAEVCDRPQHPYTQALLAAVAVPDPQLQARRRRASRQFSVRLADGTLAGPVTEDQCPFADRCPHVQQRCRVERPALRPGAGTTRVACHFFEQIEVPTDLVDSAPAAPADPADGTQRNSTTTDPGRSAVS
jgi:peptide/nickel transport system ATP-binding protein